MLSAIIVIFVLSYLAIAAEHALGVSKSAVALIAAGLLWTVYAVGLGDPRQVSERLAESLSTTAQIVFFLMGAMTIVEVIDAHDGFDVITSRIRTTRLTSLMWLIGFVAFFLSAILDNLTTAIVMVTLVRKLVDRHEDRLLLSGVVVITANAGGVWSPIGDVTTTMLWIGGHISSIATIRSLFLPALVSALVPLAVTAWLLRGRRIDGPWSPGRQGTRTPPFERSLMFFLGLAILVAVPAFKSVTGLPPFMGILLGLGLLWVTGDALHRDKDEPDRDRLTLAHALSRIDLGSVMFFIGILLSVATLEHTNLLASLAGWLDDAVGRPDLIVLIIGLVSAVVDNVPLVAASMGMYGGSSYPTDHFLWQFLAYCAGTGGSILIIGSAAGVAAMGLERIRFGWYLRNISALALLGYLGGAGAYLLQHQLAP
jgi:Na+/H+ antiporter NhaD/arsenite permease-like protein